MSTLRKRKSCRLREMPGRMTASNYYSKYSLTRRRVKWMEERALRDGKEINFSSML